MIAHCLKIVSVLLCFPSFALAQSQTGWMLNTSLSYKAIPGTYYYSETAIIWDNGSFVSSFKRNTCVGARLNMLALRAEFVKPMTLGVVGFETGIDQSLRGTRNMWTRPATDNYTGGATYPSLPPTSAMNPTWNQTLEKEITTVAIPLLLKFSLLKEIANGWRIGTDVSGGRYIVMQTVHTTIIEEYVAPTGNYAAGDKAITGTDQAFLHADWIVEIKPHLLYNLSERSLLSVSAELGYLEPFNTVTGGGPSAVSEYRFGGLTYGAGFGINWKF